MHSADEEDDEVITHIRRTDEFYKKGRDLFPNDCCSDSEDSDGGSSYLEYADLEWSAADAHFAGLAAKHADPKYVPTGDLIKGSL